MTKPVRLRLSRAKGFDLQALSIATNGLPAVAVARPGKWGNPFKIGGNTIFGHATQTQTVVVDRFSEWMNKGEYQDSKERRAALPYLRGKNLACWCALDAPCHADVLLEIANRPTSEAVK